MNNIAEGFGRYTDKEFVRFLGIAYSSSYEVKSMTYLLECLDMISREEAKLLHEKTDEVVKLSKALIRYLSNNKEH